MNPSAPLWIGMNTMGLPVMLLERTAQSIACGTSRSMAALTFSGWRNLSSMRPRVPRMVSPRMS